MFPTHPNTTNTNRPSNPAGPRGDDGWCIESIRTRPEITAVLDRLDHALTARGYQQEDAFAVRLALQEALTNAVIHGNRNDPNKQARLRYRVDDDRVQAEVEDQGEGFDPKDVGDPLAAENLSRPGGRGLFLMKSLTTSLRFNERGNGVSMCRQRQQ